MNPKYKIVTAQLPEKLQERVEGLLSEGWELSGGVSTATGVIYQALVKKANLLGDLLSGKPEAVAKVVDAIKPPPIPGGEPAFPEKPVRG